LVGAGAAVGVGAGVAVKVGSGVAVGIAVGGWVGVAVTVGSGVAVDVAVGGWVGVNVLVGVLVGVSVRLGVAVAAGVGVAGGVNVGVAGSVGVMVGMSVAVGVMIGVGVVVTGVRGVSVGKMTVIVIVWSMAGCIGAPDLADLTSSASYRGPLMSLLAGERCASAWITVAAKTADTPKQRKSRIVSINLQKNQEVRRRLPPRVRVSMICSHCAKGIDMTGVVNGWGSMLGLSHSLPTTTAIAANHAFDL
jgi:hypothetical protein